MSSQQSILLLGWRRFRADRVISSIRPLEGAHVIASKGHFALLDGLRGLAAISVVAYHFGSRSNLSLLMPRGYLAVDFFFVLSGFVLAHAYQERLRHQVTAGGFVVRRLVRLLPILIPGAVIGGVIELGRPGVARSLTHLLEIGGISLLSCLAIPWPFATSMEQTIFPINGPVWSLFFELLANFVFVAVAKAARPRLAAWALVVIGGVGMLAYGVVAGTIDVGALLINWPGGLPRVMFSFFAGLLVFAYRDRFPSLPTWLVCGVLVAAFMAPLRHDGLDLLVDLGVAWVVFPMLVGVASNGQVRRCGWLCAWAGDVSYPVYAIHYPIVRLIGFALVRSSLPVAGRLGLVVVGIGLVTLLGWLALRWYDRPVRRVLMDRLRARARAS
jgi:peptidoglycan/LPS O-acetylase OafA/YrhL